jgi:hypothetical protein
MNSRNNFYYSKIIRLLYNSLPYHPHWKLKTQESYLTAMIQCFKLIMPANAIIITFYADGFSIAYRLNVRSFQLLLHHCLKTPKIICKPNCAILSDVIVTIINFFLKIFKLFILNFFCSNKYRYPKRNKQIFRFWFCSITSNRKLWLTSFLSLKQCTISGWILLISFVKIAGIFLHYVFELFHKFEGIYQ